ncbi:hypothetical protein ANO11243_060500 [Dothideomycetidae sp. 11243]|nr:hypothetical protein ANO11243_060500 [fungal sp. No.11243]
MAVAAATSSNNNNSTAQKPAAQQQQQSRPSNRRLPSASSSAWGRLRAPAVDPLEAYGLVSKGDTRLNDSKAQESYFRLVVDRYMAFCSASGSGDSLTQAFSEVHISIPPPSTPSSSVAELSRLLSAMRKLRESLTATHRVDAFAQRALLFVLRAALLTSEWETYVPVLGRLLRWHMPARAAKAPLPNSEASEVLGLAVLDAACRRGSFGDAWALRRTWRARGVRTQAFVDEALRAVVRDDWIAFRRLMGSVDGYARAVLGFAEQAMRMHVLKVIGRGYHRIDLAVLEEWTGMEWDKLVKECGVGWERDGATVMVRRPPSS